MSQGDGPVQVTSGELLRRYQERSFYSRYAAMAIYATSRSVQVTRMVNSKLPDL